MKTIMFGMAMAMLATAPAFAQTATANSQSGASSTSSSGSTAYSGGSRASVTQIYNFSDPPAATTSGDPTSHIQSQADERVRYSGSYTVRNVPEVIAPSFGGTNVCAVGASGGIGVAGFGMTLGGSWSDSGCERRSSAVVLYQMGEHNAAIALMCQDPHVAQAMQAVGCGCGPVSRPVAAATPPAPPATVAAAPPTPSAPAAHPPVRLASATPDAAGACASLPPNASAADRLMVQYNCHAARP